MVDYYNDEEFSEMQDIVKLEELRMLKTEMRCVTSDIFIEFINWLARDCDWNGSEICSVVEKPYLYKKQFAKFIEEREEL